MHWLIVGIASLGLWSGAALATPPSSAGQAAPAGSARPTDSERSETPRVPERRGVPRLRDAIDSAEDSGIAPKDRRILPA